MKASKQLIAIFLYSFVTFTVTCQAKNRDMQAETYLKTNMQVGQEFGNIFSRTISFQIAGFDPFVRRVSGSGDYKVIAVSSQQVILDGHFLYDGNPLNNSKNVIKDGGRVVCWKDDCAPATDASGLSINPLLWGAPTGALHVGQTWNVHIAVPWELGPAGEESVTVISLDSKSGSVTLKREGEGDGAFADDIHTLTLIKDKKSYGTSVSNGHAKWSGLTTFRNGIIISDALIVERPVTVSNQDLGASAGTERQYILLNAVPPNLVRDKTVLANQ